MAKEIARKYFIPKRRFYPRRRRLLARFAPSNKGVDAHPQLIRGNMITAIDGFFQVRKPVMPTWVNKLKEQMLGKDDESAQLIPKGFLCGFMQKIRESHSQVSSQLTYQYMLPTLEWLAMQEE